MAYPDAVLALGPTGYWKLDETAGTSAADSSATGRSGTYQNTPTLNQATLLAGDPSGKAVDFNRAQVEWVQVPHHASLNFGSQITVVAWVNLDSVSVNQKFAHRGLTSSPFTELWTFEANSAELRFGLNFGGGLVFHGAAAALATATTYMLAATYDGSNMRLYRNGAQVGTAKAQSGSFSTGTAGIGLASSATGFSGACMDGRLDEVAVFNRALTAQEIADLYTAGVTEPTIDVALGRAAETDSARALTASKIASLAGAQESDQPRALTLAKTLALGRAVEQAAARTLQAVKRLTPGRATEANTARPLTASKRTTLGRASETNHARAVTATKAIPLGRATETNTARQLSVTLTGSLILRRATEQDQARPLTATKTIQLGRAVESSRAGAFELRRNLTLGRAVETITARAVTLTKTLNVGRARETDVARAFTFPGPRLTVTATATVRSKPTATPSTRTKPSATATVRTKPTVEA